MTSVSTAVLPRPGLADVARRWLTRRQILILVAVGLAAGAAGLGWPWLAAAGLAPILLSIAPCAAMCALGICAMKACGKAEAAPVPSPDGSEPPVSAGPNLR